MEFIKYTVLTLLLFSFGSFSQEIVIVVNKNNTIDELSKREVIDIYMGRYTTFPNGTIAKPLDLPAESEIKNDFYYKLVNQSEQKLNSYWARALFSGRAKPPISVSSINEALGHVTGSEYTLAYIPESKLTNDVKVVYRLNEN